jgi:L-amino acid N-acyltransferase YncA
MDGRAAAWLELSEDLPRSAKNSGALPQPPKMSIEIRFARPEDAADIVAIYGPYCDGSVISFELAAPTVNQMRERIERITQQFPWLVCEIDGDVAGYVYACSHRERAAYRWAVDVAVYIAPKHHRRGIGHALYSVLFYMLREQGYVKAYAGVTLPNPGSVGLHEAVGFRPLATYRGVGFKFGKWLDVGWWELDLRPQSEKPHEPIPISSVTPSDSLTQAMLAAEKLVKPNRE